ncbi:hypothetical protein [Alloprevotella tannerae]|uniref:hypothetical protein n=1 Tax=Alloprevotella tannerae TaxID=76122 RepID=UPI0025CE023C|nr:hypothetical protein [Alloprevotella tannerae]
MKKVLVLACLMLSSVAFIPSNVCASNSGNGGPLDWVLIHEHLKAVQEVGRLENPRSGHHYIIYEATTRSGKIIKYAVDEMGRVFYDLNNLP